MPPDTPARSPWPAHVGPAGSWRGVWVSPGDGAAVLVAAGLPAAAERLVQRHRAGVDRRLGLGQVILGGELSALGVEQFEEAGFAFLVAHARQRGGTLALRLLLDQVIDAHALLVEAGDRVVDVLDRQQHGLLVVRLRRIGTRLARV